jgi:hypothetical protein
MLDRSLPSSAGRVWLSFAPLMPSCPSEDNQILRMPVPSRDRNRDLEGQTVPRDHPSKAVDCVICQNHRHPTGPQESPPPPRTNTIRSKWRERPKPDGRTAQSHFPASHQDHLEKVIKIVEKNRQIELTGTSSERMCRYQRINPADVRRRPAQSVYKF